MDASLKEAACEAVKEACNPRTWQLGRKLFEDGQVELIGDQGVEEQVFRVWAPGRPVAPTAILYVEDEEWDCDCPSRLDACEHVAAAAHALTAGPEASSAAQDQGPRLGYRLSLRKRGLKLERVWVEESGGRAVERAVERRLGERSAGVQGGFSPREHDLKLEQLLIAIEGRVLPLETLPSAFGWLAKCEDVRLAGEAVRVSEAAPRHRARLETIEGGFRLHVEAPAGVDAVVCDGVVRIGDALHPLTHLKLVGARLERLPLTRDFHGEAVVELVSELLPMLRKGMDFDLGDAELPRLIEGLEVAPELRVRARGDALELSASLVYGDPPVARVRGGQLEVEGSRWPKRDPRAEARVARRVASRFEIEPGETRVFRAEEAAAMAERLRAYSGRIRGREQLGRFGAALTLVPRSREDGGFDLELRAGELEVALEDAIEQWQRGYEGMPLPGGGWATLPVAQFEAHAQPLLDFLAARGAAAGTTGAIPTHALGTVAELCEALDHPLPPSFAALRPLVADFEGLPSAQLPDDLAAELRSYQRRGVDWLSFTRRAGLGAMLCDDMGLGKTLQTLAVIRGDALVVAPTSLLHNWAKEAARFRPELEVVVHHGPGRKLPESLGVGTKRDRLVITSYGVLRMDRDELAARRWSLAVLDEAQTIKNPDSQVARAAFELQADFRVTLSGTPVENRLEELWSQAHFTNPGMLGGREAFKERFAGRIAAGDAGSSAALRAKLRPVLLRRLKGEVAPELPPRTEITVHCVLDEGERGLYDALRQQARQEVEALLEGGKGVISALETLLRLRQAACHRGLVPGQEAADSSKLRRLRAELEEAVAAGHKALVFSQWTSLLDRVEPGLDAMGIGYTRLDGSTRDRAAVVDAFSDPGGPPVMLLSLMAGGTGLNLVAADHVYFLDPWWNPAVEAQAADRAHRIGQDKPVYVHRLVARDTVDERILALQERKRALADAVVAEGGGSLSREDLLALLD